MLTPPNVSGASRVRQLFDSDPFALGECSGDPSDEDHHHRGCKNTITSGPGAPRFVRTLLYRYHYTTPEQKAHTGAYWRRSGGTVLTPPVSLSMLHQRGFGLGSVDPRATHGNAFTGQLMVVLATVGLVASVAPFRRSVTGGSRHNGAIDSHRGGHVVDAEIIVGGGQSSDSDSGEGGCGSATATVEIELATR